MSYDALKANYFLPQDMDYFSVQLEEMETLPLNETTGTWVTSVYNLWMESSSSFLLRARRTLTLKGTWLKSNNSKGEVSHYLSGTPVWLKTLQNQQKWKLTQKFILQNFAGTLNSILRVIRMETGWNLKKKIHILASIAFPGKIHLIFYLWFKCNAVGLGTSFLFQPVMIWNQKPKCPLKRSLKTVLWKRFLHMWKNIKLRTMNFLAHNKQQSTLK